ncbi:hypothetical protein [Leptospira sarikeiensis]|uniref:Uncharacterized protein n=1 Tax=Leptospira sarikeiensis TaxID=2484943 RepID=A0A4V3JRR2_9LEPT|nr:hypothetical protein [Leptospira sarikeiensis]TGL61381.1 hypothetical protein EHQ64_10355 [Leptospira sarikeiensis]
MENLILEDQMIYTIIASIELFCLSAALAYYSYLRIFRTSAVQNWIVNGEQTEIAKLAAADSSTIYRIKFIGVVVLMMSLVCLFLMLRPLWFHLKN